MRNGRLTAFLASITLCLAVSVAAEQKHVRAARAGGSLGSAVDVALDGNDWRMGSFEFDAGLKAGAESEKFDDNSFKVVAVPGDTQLQAGFTGVKQWFQTKELMAVNAHEWWYRKHFRAKPKAAGTVNRLVFDGVDYFTTVWLNGQLLGTHEGTYTSFSFDVTDKLHYGADNVLAVLVTHPWIPKGRGLLEYLVGDLTLINPGLVAPLKNPPYFIAAGWGGPGHGNAAFDMGIWQGVHLRTEALVTLSDLHVETTSIADDGSATLRIEVTVSNAGREASSASVSLKLKSENFDGSPQDLPPLALTAAPGETKVTSEFRLPQARLWWSWDKGAQNLYKLEAVIPAAKGVCCDQRSAVFGIRTISRDPDMAYRLNGRKIFVKASWFSMAEYYRSTTTAESYERDLRLFRNANFNLVVNFTIVEKAAFYDLCDRLGILVVTELPFSQFGPLQILDKDSPRRESFLDQARLQVSQIVTALRNHPSIIEWAPLAEAHEKDGVWSNGADQEGYDTFTAQMKKIITGLVPSSIFHPSLCDFGEKHFWEGNGGMAWNPENYRYLFDAEAGFISEYGSASLSSYENFAKYLTSEQQWETKPGQPRWFNLPIDTAAYSYFAIFDNEGLYTTLHRTIHFVDREPRSAAELAADSQLYQAFLLKYAAQAFRRKKYGPINGIRNWNYIDHQPTFDYAVVDYDRVPKTGYWYMKRAQAPVALSFAFKDQLESHLAGSQWSAPVFVVNDLDRQVRGTVHAELLSLNGEKIVAAELPVTVAADSKSIAGIFRLTLPQKPGVYVLRASMPLGAGQPIDETSFIKVVPPAFAAPHRALLIAESKFATPIEAMVRAMGLEVDVYDENALDNMERDLVDGAALRHKYDVIWIASFQSLAKVLKPQTVTAIADSVKAGTGFIHTGGDGSFHGGIGHAAMLESTALGAVLPVEIHESADLIFGPHDFDDTLTTQGRIHEIVAAANAGASTETLDLLRHYGLPAFNLVTAKPGSRVELSISGEPLLVTGAYGAGRTAVFTGFTLPKSNSTQLPVDEYFIGEPQARAYFALFAQMLADVLPGASKPTANLLDIHEKPLFQTLKEQPQSQLAITKLEPPSIAGSNTKCRIQITNKGGYAHLVYIRFEWPQAGPKPYLAEFNDNDFELLPGESKEIDLTWKTSTPNQQVSGTLVVNAANAPETRMAF